MPSTRQSLYSQTLHQDQQLLGALPIEPISPGLNAQLHLAREIYHRRNEYVRSREVRVKIGSWNVAACAGAEKDIGEWFVDGKGISKLHGGLPTNSKTEDDNVEDAATQEKHFSKQKSTLPANDSSGLPSESEIDIYALGLQEIIDINSATEALRPFVDSIPTQRWKDSVAEALPAGYVLVAEQQLSGLLLLIYASPSIASTISSVSTMSVGTGLMGYLGNKGAVSARIILGEITKVVFINCHLAAGNDKASLERRNWDVSQIIQRTKFAPIDHGNGIVDETCDCIGDEDFAFWFGDLNYRLAGIPGDDVRRLLLLHTRNEYDEHDATRQTIDKELNIKKEPNQIEKTNTEVLDPSDDPTSALTTITSLMAHDQLHYQMKTRNAFHEGWQEGPIQFLPTYKYDIGSVGMFDSSEKRRSPSWCDRILYRSRKHHQEWLREEKETEKIKKCDLEMKARGLEKETEEDIIFDYDPETDGDNRMVTNSEGLENATDQSQTSETTPVDSANTLELEYYISHQRVLSSDHKPMDAIFSMGYTAVDPDLKAKVHQAVVKEIDRQENEGRPSVTAIFESFDLHGRSSEGCQFGDLRFLQEKVIMFTVANTSPVPATFEFLNQDGSNQKSTWLRIGDHNEPRDRSSYKPLPPITLGPGDSANLEVIALVYETKDLYNFNIGIAKPEEILILRVQRGKDHFITVHARWLQSCFGLSIEKLVRLSRNGVRNQALGNELDEKEVTGSTPKELFRLTEALEENISLLVLDKASLDATKSKIIEWPFAKASIEETIRNSRLLFIRDALDTGSAINLPDLNNLEKAQLFGQTIVTFLSFMPGRIISISLWNQLLASLVEHEKLKQMFRGEELRNHVLDILSTSPSVSVSFTFISFMLARIITQLAAEDSISRELHIPETPLSPKTPDTLLRRTRGLSLRHDSQMTRRQQIEAAYVEQFVPLIFETDSGLTNARSKKSDLDRKKHVLAAFLGSKDD